MFVRPNERAKVEETKTKNDLYRKFRHYIAGATERDFHRYASYSVDGYISVHKELEEQINDILTHNIDEIIPITGATGIGKTYLMLYCLKKYYGVEDIPTNTPVLFPSQEKGKYDLVYYSDFNITEPSVLENIGLLCFAKVSAMYEYVLNCANLGAKKVEDVGKYINDYKLEVKYYSEDNKQFEEALFKLTILLSSGLPIKNVVFVFDDLESLKEQQQVALMAHFLTLFENLKTKSRGCFCSKFFFCLRNNTYYNIYKDDMYNTHRANKALNVSVAPSLSKIFQRRFDIIIASDQVKKAQNEKTWEKAKNVLLKIADRIDNSYNNILLKINNNNVSKALESYLEIISNRRWTQKNVNPASSFIIEEDDYYINDTNILRILCMGEKNVYFQTKIMPIRCILPKPGVHNLSDILSFWVLQAFRYRNRCAQDTEEVAQRLLSPDELIHDIYRCIVPNKGSDQDRKRAYDDIKDAVQRAFSYYEDNRFIRKNVDPMVESGEIKYFMLPRGEQIFDLFFSQSILFGIFRDAYLLDTEIFNAKNSSELSFEELTTEAFNYERQLMSMEGRLLGRVKENGEWPTYYAMLGQYSLSSEFLYAIEKSIEQFYKEKDDPKYLRAMSAYRALQEEVKKVEAILLERNSASSWI